jgi:hypothetical protein
MNSNIIPITGQIAHNARIGRKYTANANLINWPEKKSDDQSIIARIITEYKNLNRKQIDDYTNAIRSALDVVNPRRYLLQDLYDDYSRDGHLKSQYKIRDGASLSSTFEVTDDVTGDADPVTTKLFKKQWFYNWMKLCLSYYKNGYCVLELTNPKTMKFKLVPRRNVLPEQHVIVFQINGMDGIDYTTGYENRLMEIGSEDEMGVLFDIIPQLIWKRNSQQSWAEFSEKFGMPLITATTSKTNDRDLDKLESLLEALGESARAVLPQGTSIDVKPFAGKDSYQVYDAQINRCNSEISKPIVGGTMATDSGSSRSQSEVHERNLDDKIAAEDRLFLTFLVNDKLIPMMRAWGWKIPENRSFSFPESFELNLTQHWAIVQQLLQFYNVPMEWISKTFNIPLDSIKEAIANPTPPADPNDPNDPNEPNEPDDQNDPNEPGENEPPVKGKKPGKKAKPAASFFE